MKKWIVISISIIILAVAGYFGYQFATESGSSVPIATAPIPPAMNESNSTEDLVVQKKWIPGEKVVMEINVISEADVQMPKEQKPMHTRSEVKQQISLCELSTSPEGGHVFEFGFEEMAVNVNAGKENVVYSSKDSPSNDPKNPFPAIFNALINHKIILAADKDMKVTSVSGLEELSADMSKNIKSHEMKSLFGMDNSSYYNNMLNGFFMDASTHPIKVGESWNTQKSTEVPNLGIMNSNITHTFSGWKDYNGTKVALINFSGKITTTGTMNDKKSGFGMSMKDSSISGYSFVDPQTGQSLEYSMNLNSSMEMKIPQRTSKGTTEMKMSMLMKQNTSGKIISRTKTTTTDPAINIAVTAPDSTLNTTLSTDTK